MENIEHEKKGRTNPKGSVMLGRLFLLFCVVVVLVLGVTIYAKYRTISDYEKSRSEKYYAVFLANGQVYFGHFKYDYTAFPELSDIYYLKPTAQTSGQTAQQYSLVKLGKELYGPKDLMTINRDQLLYWQEISSDSSVMKAIKDYQKNGGAKLTEPINAGN